MTYLWAKVGYNFENLSCSTFCSLCTDLTSIYDNSICLPPESMTMLHQDEYGAMADHGYYIEDKYKLLAWIKVTECTQWLIC